MDKKKNNLKPWELALVFGVAAVFSGQLSLIVGIYRNLNRNGSLAPIYHPRQQHIPRKQLQIDNIKSWMDFDYLNRSFQLQPNYLQAKLNITDKKYPNITIDSWAKKSVQDPNKIIEI